MNFGDYPIISHHIRTTIKHSVFQANRIQCWSINYSSTITWGNLQTIDEM